MASTLSLWASWCLIWRRSKGSTPACTGSLAVYLQPLPRPLSEWRGEWRLLFANKGGVSSMQGKPLFDRKKRLSRLEKGVSLILLKASPSPSKGGDVLTIGFFFDSKIQLSLIPLTTLFHPTNSIHAPLHSERGRGWGCRWTGMRLFFDLHWPYFFLPVSPTMSLFRWVTKICWPPLLKLTLYTPPFLSLRS